MGIPIFLVLFLIFIIVFRYRLAKSEKLTRKANKEFWDKEQSSHFIRKKQIYDNDFIKANLAKFPTYSLEAFRDFGNEDLYSIQQKCLAFGQKPMMNLSHLLNSDIRLQYGTANLELIQSYEENHINYVKNLYKLGQGYYDISRFKDAIWVLQEGLKMKTDISQHYILLGKLYLKENMTDEFKTLREQIQRLDVLTQKKIMSALDELSSTILS